jgi:Protein of unknown function (DUF1552)
MIITKKCLPRRTFLRGLGVALGLPLLDGMIPALASASDAAAQPATRLTFIYVPNGIMDLRHEFTPFAEGGGFELTPILTPLAPFRDHLLVLSGLAHMEGRSLPGEAGGDHSRASASFLTGVHCKKTEGADLQAGVSLDQIAAKELAEHTQLASLELALDSTETIGECEAGYSCAYTNTLCWRSPTTPLPMENHPRAVFENLFGDSNSTDPKVRLAQARMEHSILDSLTEDVRGLVKTLGSSDCSKLTEYLEAIRDVERRIQLAEEQSSRNLPVVERPIGGIPATFEEHAKLMFDLQVLAYQCDLTRVTTFMMGHETTTRAFPEIGIPDSHHPLTHHGGDAEKIAKVIKINTLQTRMLAYFLDKLKSAPDGDGCLLDHSAILYGSGLSDGNLHLHDNLTAVLAGGGAGKIRGGRHRRYADKTPMPSLYGTLLDVVGIPLEDLGTSAGKLEPLSIA